MCTLLSNLTDKYCPALCLSREKEKSFLYLVNVFSNRLRTEGHCNIMTLSSETRIFRPNTLRFPWICFSYFHFEILPVEHWIPFESFSILFKTFQPLTIGWTLKVTEIDLSIWHLILESFTRLNFIFDYMKERGKWEWKLNFSDPTAACHSGVNRSKKSREELK